MSCRPDRCFLSVLFSASLFASVSIAQLDADFTARPTSGTIPLTVEFTDASTGGTPAIWVWDFGDASPQSMEQNPTHTYESLGPHTVSLTVISGFDVDTEIKTDVVTVDPAPLVPGFTADPESGPPPLTVSFTDATTGSVPTAWLWNFEDGETSIEQSPTHTYAAPGTYSVSLKVSYFAQQETVVEPDLITVTGQTIFEIIDISDGMQFAIGIAADEVGRAYVANGFVSNVFEVTPEGEKTKIIDHNGAGPGQELIEPWGVDTDSAGNVFVSAMNTDNVFRIAPDGAITQILDATGDGNGSTLAQPRGLTVDASGNAYVAGTWSDNVFRVTPEGEITEIIDAAGDGVHPLDGAFDVAVDGAGNVYVVGEVSDNAFRISTGGEITQILDATGDGAGHPLDRPAGVAASASGDVFVTGRDSDNAFRVSPDGDVTQILDASGDGAGQILDGAHGVAVDGAGNVYVTGQFSDNAFKISPLGTVTEIIDESGDGTGQFNVLLRPLAIDVNGLGDAYVSGSGSGNAFRIVGAECFLVIGNGAGDASFFEIGHVFETQLDAVESAYAVTMEDIPEFVLPVTASGLGGVGASTAARTPVAEPPTGALTPAWMLDSALTVQVLMWNPGVFPDQPEQFSVGLAVVVLPDGGVATTPFGAGAGIEVWAETDVNEQGQAVVRFPFSIQGM